MTLVPCVYNYTWQALLHFSLTLSELSEVNHMLEEGSGYSSCSILFHPAQGPKRLTLSTSLGSLSFQLVLANGKQQPELKGQQNEVEAFTLLEFPLGRPWVPLCHSLGQAVFSNYSSFSNSFVHFSLPSSGLRKR